MFAGLYPLDNIRYIYELSGGAMMHLGAYTVDCLRGMFGVEMEKCLEAKVRRLPLEWDQNIDQAFDIKWQFPNGAIGEANIDLAMRGGYWFPWLTKLWPSLNIPKCTAIHREVVVEDDTLQPGQEHITIKTVTLWNMMAPHLWHRIDIENKHEVRDESNGKILKTWKEMEYQKAYTFPEERNLSGQAFWSTYRWMLEEFVNGVKGRKGSGVWMRGEDSIGQMAMIDSAYEKSGMPLRPTHTFE